MKIKEVRKCLILPYFSFHGTCDTVSGLRPFVQVRTSLYSDNGIFQLLERWKMNTGTKFSIRTSCEQNNLSNFCVGGMEFDVFIGSK
jgi:hypothetical protein